MHTTINGFLGGRLQIEQPRSGYRAGIDPVLLAASVPARAGDQILDMGCGVGTALLCLMCRVQGLEGVGVDIQESLIAMARRNADLNTIQARFFIGDLQALPHTIRQMDFDHILANPPFFDRNRTIKSDNEIKELGRGEDIPLSVWLETALRRLRPKGMAHFILQTPQLVPMIEALVGRRAALQVLPIVPRHNGQANLVLLRVQKDSAAPFKLFSPQVLHQGSVHKSDKEKDYSPEIEQVLRYGAQLPWPKG